jgi:hypothetical protein
VDLLLTTQQLPHTVQLSTLSTRRLSPVLGAVTGDSGSADVRGSDPLAAVELADHGGVAVVKEEGGAGVHRGDPGHDLVGEPACPRGRGGRQALPEPSIGCASGLSSRHPAYAFRWVGLRLR